MEELYQLSAYQYDLPAELIAQHPVHPRDQSRLMIVERKSGNISEIVFRELSNMLGAGDALVFNNTKVIPARLFGQKESGGNVEILLSKPLASHIWEVLCRPARKVRKGQKIRFSDTFFAVVCEDCEEGRKILQFFPARTFEQELEACGHMPLPGYIKRPSARAEDRVQYQTVFAKEPGAAAAPTAGLHFTQDLLTTLKSQGVHTAELTLHVGLGTFKPVQACDIRQHKMHFERLEITPEAAHILNRAHLRKIAVGTTCCRSLEACATQEGKIVPEKKETDLFIYPGYQFKSVQALLTNFHLPCSSLLMLVSAFGGYDLIREAYKKAIKARYRFYSYGDAMLIL